MISVPPLDETNEPGLFDRNCREPGNSWLAAYPKKDPHEKSEWWSQFQPELANHFSHLCGWLGTCIGLKGNVEHYLSCGNRKSIPSPHRNLAFEWSNYRYADPRVNSRKGKHDDAILDPCEIEDGWFKVILPSFQLVLTDQIPGRLREKAEFTLKQLQLRRGYDSRWTRWDWYKRYWNDGKPDLEKLRSDAPLVATAVDCAIRENIPLPDPANCRPGYTIKERKRKYKPRKTRNS